MPSFSTIGSMDMSGTTAQRPTNAEIGQTYFDTTLGALAVYNGTSWEVEGGDVATSTVAAAGTNQGTAAVLSTGFNLVTAADGTKGVKLPTAAAGVTVEGYNNSASALKVYPNTSDDINDGTVNVHVTVAANTAFRFVASDSVTWAGVYAAGGTYATLTGTEELTNKTLTTPVHTLSVQVLAAAGTVQGDAGAITAGSGALIHVTGADATKGAVLPAAAAGKYYIVKNDDTANAILKLYPATGDVINALAANAALSMAAKTSCVIAAIDATTWYTVPLLPS